MIARRVRDKTPRIMRGKSHGRKKAIFAASLHNVAGFEIAVSGTNQHQVNCLGMYFMQSPPSPNRNLRTLLVTVQ